MYKQHNEVMNREQKGQSKTFWLDAVDLELIFMNSIVICVVLLAIVAADFILT